MKASGKKDKSKGRQRGIARDTCEAANCTEEAASVLANETAHDGSAEKKSRSTNGDKLTRKKKRIDTREADKADPMEISISGSFRSQVF